MEQKHIYTEGTYLANNPTWHEEDSPWKAAQILRMLQQHTIPTGSICEVGCGAGEILNQLHAHFPTTEFWGYEMSPHAFERAKSKQKERLQYSNDNLFEIPIERPFDIGMAIDVFEHVENPFEFIRNLRQKSTWQIFHIPLDLSVSAMMRPSSLINTWKKVGHLNYYTKELALKTLEEAGCNIVDAHFTSGALELRSTYSLKTHLANIPRRLIQTVSKDWAQRILGGYALLVLTK